MSNLKKFLGVMKTSVKWTSTSRKAQSGRCQPRKRQCGRRRPVEKLSLVDVDQENVSVVVNRGGLVWL